MATDVLLVDEDDRSNRSTLSMTVSELSSLIGSAQYAALPADEGLDENTCYTLLVKVTG